MSNNSFRTSVKSAHATTALRARNFRAFVSLWSQVIVLCSVLGFCGLSGCEKVLFPKDQPRTQFENYDRMRNQDAPLEEPDVFGNPQPALRARLGRNS